MDLLKLRKSKNVTQDDVAQYLSITRQAYSRYERNEREPDIHTLIKLADYFDITLDMLLNDDCCYFADKKLIDILESVKRGRTIHCSFLDQSAFYYYLKSGAFQRYVKNVRKYYKDKFKLVMDNLDKYVDYKLVTGEGGLHVFVVLDEKINTRELLDLCYKDKVLFMPGDIFYSDPSKGHNTFRIGFGRVSDEDIIKGLKVIGKNIRWLASQKS